MMKSLINNNLGKKLLVENCQQVKVAPFIERLKSDLRNLLITSFITVNDCEIGIMSSETGNGGERYWFSCPICNRRTGILYNHPIHQSLGCRLCLNLDYRKRRYKGMIESLI